MKVVRCYKNYKNIYYIIKILLQNQQINQIHYLLTQKSTNSLIFDVCPFGG